MHVRTVMMVVYTEALPTGRQGSFVCWHQGRSACPVRLRCAREYGE